MQLLTDIGYKNIEDCIIGEKLIAYDINDGHVIINELEQKQWLSPDMFEDEYDEEGILVRTKEQIFIDTYGDFTFLKINNTWTLFKNQSVWANLRVVHASDLQIGDTIYNDDDGDIVIDSIVEESALGWWRLTVSGDHSYIADNITLHNASRYWVGGGASGNWNATGNTNWGSASGTQDNASVPASTDDVTFNGAGTGGNSNSTISATITILSLNITSGYTATMTHNAVLTIAGNWTYGTSYTIAGTSGITISATSTITSNGVTWPNALTFSNTNIKTLSGNLTISGLLTISGTTTINRTSAETITTSGGITVNAALSGTAKVILTGGTWSGTNTTGIANNLDINGNITVSGNVYYGGGTLTYVTGTVNIGGKLFITNNSTLNVAPITWVDVEMSGVSMTVTLTSNLNLSGTLTLGATSSSFLINISRSSNEIIYCYGLNIGLTNNFGQGGNAIIYLQGGVLQSLVQSFTSNTGGTLGCTLYLNGNITINGNIGLGRVSSGGGANYFQHLSGIITTINANLYIQNNSTFIDFHKIPFRSITITTSTITMNRFFNGTPKNICQITAFTTNYTITFQDGFEKMARNVAINGCTLSRPLQLLVINNARFNTNRSTNVGIRYINQSPNGIARNAPSIQDTMTVPAMGLSADPNFIKQG